MDAIKFLRDDHKIIKGLFRQFEAVDERAPEMKEGLVHEIFMEIEIHTQLENEFFYPELTARVDASDRGLVEQARSDHREISSTAAQLKEQNVFAEHFNDRFSELISLVEAHLGEEERTLFPLAERVLADVTEELCDLLMIKKEELMESPEYSDAIPEVVQNPHGGEQMRTRSRQKRKKAA